MTITGLLIPSTADFESAAGHAFACSPGPGMRCRPCRRLVAIRVGDRERSSVVSRLTRLTVVAIGALVVATAAQAQTIAGTVRDTSGAVMPGVTVEAASPALIERMRTVVTDGSGQYKIVSLTPGVYTVTFTLPGFTTVQREGIELMGDFTASVNVELKVGSLEETITVAGATPLVDVQSLTKPSVFTREVLD